MSENLHKLLSSYATKTTIVNQNGEEESKVSMVSFSKIHIKAFQKFNRELANSKTDEDTKELNAAINILATSSIEARINEVLSFKILLDRKNEYPELKEIKSKEKQLDVKSKWNEIAEILSLDKYDASRDPFQSYSQIQSLRNELVHFKGDFVEAEETPNKKIKAIKAKFHKASKANESETKEADKDSKNWVEEILENKELGKWIAEKTSELHDEIETNFMKPKYKNPYGAE